MNDKEGVNPMFSKMAGGPDPTNPMGGLASILNPGYGSSMEAAPQGMASVAPEQGTGLDQTVMAPKQKKLSFLAKLGDAFLASQDVRPVFRRKFEQNQLKDAMEGFADDPVGAIKRIAQHNPQLAWDLFNKHNDDARQQGVADRQLKVADARINQYHQGVVASMYGAANAKNWGQMAPYIRKYVADNNVQLPFEVSDVYDENADNLAFSSGIKPKDQVSLEQGDRRLDQGDVRLEQGQARVEQGATRLEDNREYRDTRIGQIDRGLDERERSNRVRESKPTKQSPGTRNVEIKDSKGNIRVVTINPHTGKAGSIVNGKLIKYTIVNGKLVVDKSEKK